MHLASLDRNFWELRSGEEAYLEHPDTFWLPPLEERSNLTRGSAAKLIFLIEAEGEGGEIMQTRKRMWVIISEKVGDVYFGILDSHPASLEPGPAAQLAFGYEIPFRAEHVIDIATPPQSYVDWQLSQPPEKSWPRGD